MFDYYWRNKIIGRVKNTNNNIFFNRGGDLGSIHIWDQKTLNPVKSFKGHIMEINDLLPLKNQRLVSCSTDSKIIIWNIITG